VAVGNPLRRFRQQQRPTSRSATDACHAQKQTRDNSGHLGLVQKQRPPWSERITSACGPANHQPASDSHAEYGVRFPSSAPSTDGAKSLVSACFSGTFRCGFCRPLLTLALPLLCALALLIAPISLRHVRPASIESTIADSTQSALSPREKTHPLGSPPRQTTYTRSWSSHARALTRARTRTVYGPAHRFPGSTGRQAGR